MALAIFKLQKFTILSYTDSDRTIKSVPSPMFEAQFNPAEIQWKYGISYSCSQAINSSAKQQTYEHSKAAELSVTLLVDGTGVDSFAIVPPVASVITNFKWAAYEFIGNKHEPPYLKIQWGFGTTFKCRLRSFTVKYTLFNRDGSPLRAEIAAVFVGDISDKERGFLENKSSPDLTHARVVHVGDTLPLLTKDIYGSSDRYLDVAHYNGLNHFRRLVPGQELLFPPLAVFESKERE